MELEGGVTGTDEGSANVDRSGCGGEQRWLRLSGVCRKGPHVIAGGDMAVAHAAAVGSRVIVLVGRRARQRPVAGSVIGGVIVRSGRQRRGRGRPRDAVVDRAMPHPEGLTLGRREEHGGKENSGRAPYESDFANHPRSQSRSYHSIGAWPIIRARLRPINPKGGRDAAPAECSRSCTTDCYGLLWAHAAIRGDGEAQPRGRGIRARHRLHISERDVVGEDVLGH